MDVLYNYLNSEKKKRIDFYQLKGSSDDEIKIDNINYMPCK